ncbi:hypothetical protein BCV69DRAFT_301931 [Microstroma glucosiphilum]|uniref:Uncharacterized protein n=1 Tax=Pseudomicrostroma glucosiphilum TaxID=1684307 RepID=A0A316TVZ6_9BASI|nr:hypothetical protein BCV69DRAFT_301931 [Pseudomicrostroma glucosiphilum]PWN17696.1 hypothetical protein BCV69DRAFT_301931 [Pseudomicrostroma glucosiphilum]
MEVNGEPVWVDLGQTKMPHLRSYLRARPNFDPTVARDQQESLGHTWAKEFWDREHSGTTPPAEWYESWTTLKSKSGSGSLQSQGTVIASWNKLKEAYEDPDRSFCSDDNSLEEDKDSEMEEGGSKNVIKFVPSASALGGDEDWRGRLSRKEVKTFEAMLEVAVLQDQLCFRLIRECVEKVITPDERPRAAIPTGNPSADHLRYVFDSINKLFDRLRKSMRLPDNSRVPHLRPLDHYLEWEVRQAHMESRVAEGMSELLDRIDVVLLALGVPAPRGETVVSDRLIHQYLYRLSDCQERVMTHRKNADRARQVQGPRRAGTSSELGQRRGSRYVSRPLSLATGVRDGTNSRASSASAGSPVAASPV